MILTSQNLVHYLVDRGLVPARAVVDGDFAVRDLSRRNRNFHVRVGPGGLFVKQPQDWEPHSTETLRREASCYLLARDDPDFAALAELLPRFHHFDAEALVLVLELLPAEETMAEWQVRQARFPAPAGARLGTMLGRYHRHAGALSRDARTARAFPRGMPWILNIMHHNPSHLGPVSGGNTEMLEILSAHPEFGAALDAVRGGWRAEALVHGDLKWENCMVLPGGDPDAPALKIVDWELADFGDPCWDVGSIFQSYLTCWILSIPEPDQAHPSLLPERARFPLEGMQPSMNAFWDAYVGTLGADPRAAAERLKRSILYAAARMLQTAWEWTAYAPEVSPAILCLLQVAMNVLTRPDEAVVHLLGIEGRMAA